MPSKAAAATAEKPEKPLHLGHRARLRERFLNGGPDALHDYELLEMVLYAAIPRGDVKPLAKALIQKFGSFSKVITAEPAELMTMEGVGSSAAASVAVIKAACERLLLEEASEAPVLNNYRSVLDYCNVHFKGSKIEELHLIYLNRKYHVIRAETMHKGTVDATQAYPREIVKRALELGAAGIIMAHNHPSGDPTPSKGDIEITRQVVTACQSMNIVLHDHYVIGRNKHFSFRSNGLLA